MSYYVLNPIPLDFAQVAVGRYFEVSQQGADLFGQRPVVLLPPFLLGDSFACTLVTVGMRITAGWAFSRGAIACHMTVLHACHASCRTNIPLSCGILPKNLSSPANISKHDGKNPPTKVTTKYQTKWKWQTKNTTIKRFKTFYHIPTPAPTKPKHKHGRF